MDDTLILCYAILFGFVQVMRTYVCRKDNCYFMVKLLVVPIMYYFIAKIIVDFTPQNLRPGLSILPIILCTLILYYVFFKPSCVYDMIDIDIDKSRQVDIDIDGTNKKLQIETGTINFKDKNTQIPITNINIL